MLIQPKQSEGEKTLVKKKKQTVLKPFEIKY